MGGTARTVSFVGVDGFLPFSVAFDGVARGLDRGAAAALGLSLPPLPPLLPSPHSPQLALQFFATKLILHNLRSAYCAHVYEPDIFGASTHSPPASLRDAALLGLGWTGAAARDATCGGGGADTFFRAGTCTKSDHADHPKIFFRRYFHKNASPPEPGLRTVLLNVHGLPLLPLLPPAPPQIFASSFAGLCITSGAAAPGASAAAFAARIAICPCVAAHDLASSARRDASQVRRTWVPLSRGAAHLT